MRIRMSKIPVSLQTKTALSGRCSMCVATHWSYDRTRSEEKVDFVVINT